jgi:uncharacterized membrane protein
MNQIQIRYNTKSVDDTDRWRIIENGKEYLTSDIVIDNKIKTSKDWIEEISDFKWYISCQGAINQKDGIVYVTTSKEKKVIVRHILKTISYRILGTLTTVVTAYLLGASLELSSILGVAELVVKPLIYFIHERVWYKNIRLH